jgi:hypothetical protein
MELELKNQSKKTIEEELISKQSDIQQFQFLENQLNKKVSEFEYEVLAKEKALASSEKLLEVILSEIKPNVKGNAINRNNCNYMFCYIGEAHGNFRITSFA